MFDVVGDVHGCPNELLLLLEKLGYTCSKTQNLWAHPAGRKLVFVGDLNDRGPSTDQVFDIAMKLQSSGVAYFILGNHDWKLLKVLRSQYNKTEYRGNIGRDLSVSLTQIYSRGPEFQKKVYNFLNGLGTIFQTPELLVVHGAYRPELNGGQARDFNLYGETDGTRDEDGYPNRLDNWKHDLRGSQTVVVGHEPLYKKQKRADKSRITNAHGVQVVNVDWGCCFGGELAAYRYPENDIVTVSAAKVYHDPRKNRKPMSNPSN